MINRPTLICIPDISGFTKFMSETNSDLSHKVVSSLLNKIIYTNTIDLKVSEIEGDAIFFYLPGELPSFEILLKQCRHFHDEFYKQLKNLTNQNSGNEDSENINHMLGLKIILHYGEHVEAVQIGSRIKLMGEDVIIAHRLMKNAIKEDEYILFSNGLLDQYEKAQLADNMDLKQLKSGKNNYKHLGEVNYKYIVLN
ncbi:DUF2652 domain-containing protein [Subsaximicrobium wynnwilliamsii]|uniref:DUF2652 domain-containing protein n=1 Tax=Subsaximicrobium wynnwilliamsii TaxID=291179 RepID=A0A5C6ZME9_9FLAO|nr:DUF2652 domain-containing protein [Subsaximicrobium wynnwilliamsii]TXD85203.1 DUF2652 domain-containing protein [Subsaximicrobium wynnwilliamsii]TXD91246.1 DUF2652 domain-containing protein [Subsaximicrobium wynnwilliamsii]TXE04639.1 DUF2652 domain-containing protein [Subsaximicrobium wynnwilliamsii]